MRAVRVCPYRTEDVRTVRRNFKDVIVPLRAHRNGHHQANARSPRACNHAIEIGGKIRKIQMAMVVDKHDGYLGSNPGFPTQTESVAIFRA
jgi:hypothetical protein